MSFTPKRGLYLAATTVIVAVALCVQGAISQASPSTMPSVHDGLKATVTITVAQMMTMLVALATFVFTAIRFIKDQRSKLASDAASFAINSAVTAIETHVSALRIHIDERFAHVYTEFARLQSDVTLQMSTLQECPEVGCVRKPTNGRDK